jgi:hypothetical protein
LLGRPTKVYDIFFISAIIFLDFKAVPLKRKIKIKILFPSMKMLTNSKGCSESLIRISVRAFLLFHWSIFSTVRTLLDAEKFRQDVHVIGGFRENFLDHRRLLEQLLES